MKKMLHKRVKNSKNWIVIGVSLTARPPPPVVSLIHAK